MLAGGVFKACPSVAGRFAASFENERAAVTVLEGDPAAGAVTLALQELESAGS